MPAKFKLLISVLVAAVGAAVHVFERGQGDLFAAWVTVGLALLMVLAIWLFPEAGDKNS